MTPARTNDIQERPLQAHLGQLKKGESATVTGLAGSADAEQALLRTRLLELGFAPGERVRVVAESFPRRDPIAVRIGNTTFALRRQEAAMIGIARAGDAAAAAGPGASGQGRS